MTITKNATVEIRYRLLDASGEVVESTEDEGPIKYRHGAAEILPGLEDALEGASPGDEVRVTLAPEDAYGEHNPEGLVVVPRDELPDEEYSPGDWISVGLEADEGENLEEDELEMRVVEVNPDAIVMDANHPLAGQSITFEVEVVSVEG